MLLDCQFCGHNFVSSRKDRRWCSAECRQALKRAYDRDRYSTIAPEVIERACAWQRENRDRKARYDASRREDEALRARRREQARITYHADIVASRLRAMFRSHARRARLLSAPATQVTDRDIHRLRLRQQGLCVYCQQTMDVEHIEHIIPLVRGGSHSIGNIALACARCNQTKSHRFVMEWRIGKVVPRASLTIV